MSLYRSFTTLSVSCLVGNKCHYHKEKTKEELKMNCPCRKLSRFFYQFLSVVSVFGQDCRLYSKPCRLSLLPLGRLSYRKYSFLNHKLEGTRDSRKIRRVNNVDCLIGSETEF